MSAIVTDVISWDESQQIHAASVNVLERVGVEVADERIRAKLIEAGARQGVSGSRIIFPAAMVSQSLLQSPGDFEMCSVGGARLMFAPGQRHYSSCLVDPFMFDFQEGKRPPLLQDCLNQAKLVDRIDTIAFPYKMDVDYQDCEAGMGVYLSNYILMSTMAKPYLCAPHNVAEARKWVEMAEIVAGGPLREKRMLSALVSPISPLTFDKEYLGMVDYLAGAGVVMVVLPCPMSGATAPITLAGTVVMLNCEMLASIVLIQTLYPGTPIVYHSCAHSFNMASAQASLGGPEKILLGVATACMGRYYDLPCGTAGSSTDTGSYDLQNGAESMSQLLMAAGGPATLITGVGSMASGNGTSAEQILFDCECIELAHYLRRGIVVDEDRLAYEVIERVGPGGNFLMDEHTLKYLKTGEHFLAGSFDRTSQNAPVSKMYSDLHEKAQSLIAAHQTKVPESKIEQLQKYLSQKNIDLGTVNAIC